ncbi:MAG: hypothetical protein LBV73_28810 [Paraburkholderia sp.]|jgi:hypothetical protein|nr:hypothetical protein [Paraburkholderia sp.]
MSQVTGKIKEEFKKVLPPTIFFFVILHIVALIRSLMVKGTGIPMPATASILIASLILGKAVLIADMLPFINRFPSKPLVWNVSWKTLIYTLVALVIHYLERLYDYWNYDVFRGCFRTPRVSSNYWPASRGLFLGFVRTHRCA